MGNDVREKLKTVLIALILSLPVGWMLASFFSAARHGLTSRIGEDFDIFAFWYDTPFYLGYTTAAFKKGVMILGTTSFLITMATLILVFKQKHHQGSARWARPQELVKNGYIRRYENVTGPIFGKTAGPGWPGKYLTNGDAPHSLVVAPTRAGKGVGVVIPTLLTFNGSVLALDVKGELFELTSRSRKARGDQVFKFAPFDPHGRTHSYNPVLDIVNMPPDRRFSETRRLAHNLIEAKGKGSEGFIDGARDLFTAGILACIERGTPTIGAVYDLFAQPGEKYKLFAELAEQTRDPEAQRIFDNMAGNDTKILTSYTSVLGDGGLNLWADPLIKAATTTSDFSIYDLRRDPTSIFLCVSPNDLEVIAPLVRLFFQQLVSILQRTMPAKDEIFEVLFLLDEFKHLGRLEAIETAITTIAGYRGRFMFIIQSLSALTGAYEEAGKQNFLSNTGLQVFMATADDETPQYISKAIGDYTFRAKSVSYSQGKFFDANISVSDQGAPLLRPEQVRLVDDDTEIVLIKGQPPLKLKKVKYYSDRKLKKLFNAQTGPLPEPGVLHERLAAMAAAASTSSAPAYVSPEQDMDFEDEELREDGDQHPTEESTSEAFGGPEIDYDDEKPPQRREPEPEEPALSEAELQALAAQRLLLNRIIELQKRNRDEHSGFRSGEMEDPF